MRCRSGPTADGGSEQSESFHEVQWFRPDVATVLRHDPFVRPARFPALPVVATSTAGSAHDPQATAEAARAALEEALAGLRSQLDQLRNDGVQAVIANGDESVAILGDRTIRVGDSARPDRNRRGGVGSRPCRT